MTATVTSFVGSPVEQPAYERAVTSKEGLALSIRSTHAPGNVPGRPWHQIPLLIGTLMSALFSGYMAYYLAWPLAYLRRAMSDGPRTLRNPGQTRHGQAPR